MAERRVSAIPSGGELLVERNHSAIWKTIVLIQSGVIATFFFAWLTFAREAVTKQDLERELSARGIIATAPAELAGWRSTVESRLTVLERLQTEYNSQITAVRAALEDIRRRLP